MSLAPNETGEARIIFDENRDRPPPSPPVPLGPGPRPPPPAMPPPGPSDILHFLQANIPTGPLFPPSGLRSNSVTPIWLTDLGAALKEGNFGPKRSMFPPVWMRRNFYWSQLGAAVSGGRIPATFCRDAAPANAHGAVGLERYDQFSDSAIFLRKIDSFSTRLDLCIHVIFSDGLGGLTEFMAGDLGRSSPFFIFVDMSILDINNERGLLIASFDFIGGARKGVDFFVTTFNMNGFNGAKFNDLQNSVVLHRPPSFEAVYLLQETKSSDHSPALFDRFSFYGSTKSGGTSILVRKGFVVDSSRFGFSTRPGLGPSPDVQAVSASIHDDVGQPLAIIVSVYLRPGLSSAAIDIDARFAALCGFVAGLSPPGPLVPFVLGGDFNIDPVRDRVKWEKLTGALLAVGLVPLPSPGPTYRGTSTLDHIFANQIAACSAPISVARATDHSPVCTRLDSRTQPARKEVPSVPRVDTAFLCALPKATRVAAEHAITARLDQILVDQNLLGPVTRDLLGVTNFAASLTRAIFSACSSIIPVRFPHHDPAAPRPDGPPLFRVPPGFPAFWNEEIDSIHRRLHAALDRLEDRVPPGNDRPGFLMRTHALIVRLKANFLELLSVLSTAYAASRPQALAPDSLRAKHGISDVRQNVSGATLAPSVAHAAAVEDFTSVPLPDAESRWQKVFTYMSSPASNDCIDYFSASGRNPITDQDLFSAAARMNLDSCAGTDGLDARLIQLAVKSASWRTSVIALITICTRYACWPTIFSDLWLTLLYKGKDLDPKNPSSFRRICVGPRFAAFCETVLLVKLTAAPGFDFSLAFGPSQSGFIPGSGPLSESIAIQMLMDASRSAGMSTTFLSLDQKSAFDMVEFLSIIEGLVRARSTPDSARFICAFLGVQGSAGSVRMLKVRNSGLALVALYCGTPQGGSISPPLYLFSQNHMDDAVPVGAGVRLERFHPAIPPPPPIGLFRFADDNLAAANEIKYTLDSISSIFNGPRGPPLPLGADSKGQGVLHALHSSGGLLNPAKSQLFVADGPHQPGNRFARDRYLPLRSGEVILTTTPLEVLGVKYSAITAPQTAARSDPRGMNPMIRGFGGALGDMKFPIHDRRDIIYAVIVPSTTYGTYICNPTTDISLLESSLIVGLRTIVATPASYDHKSFRNLIPDDLLRKFMGCRTMTVHLGYHSVLACLQAVRSPVLMLRTVATHELLRAWVGPREPPRSFADKVINFYQALDPLPPSTPAQRQALEMSPFMAALLGTWDPAAVMQADPLPAAPVRYLSAPFVRDNVFTDGSFLRGLVNRGAFAVYFGHGDIRNFTEGIVGGGITNNRAELMAIAKALSIITTGLPPIGACPVRFTVFSDSRYCVDICNEFRFAWSLNGWKMRSGQIPKNLILIKDIHGQLCHLGPVVEISWVRAHAGNVGNVEADQMARAAAEALPAAAAPLPAPRVRPALIAYSVAKDALRKEMATKFSDGKIPKFVKSLTSLQANAYLLFAAGVLSSHDGTNHPGPRQDRLCPWCNLGADTTAHILVCASPRGIQARSVGPLWPQIVRILEAPPAPPRFPRVALAAPVGAAALSLLSERRLALLSHPPRDYTLTFRVSILRPMIHGIAPRAPRDARIPWTLPALETFLFSRGGIILQAPLIPIGNNCLFIAVAVLLRFSGADVGPGLQSLELFALRLRRTVAAHVLDHPSSADLTRDRTVRARVAGPIDDRRTARTLAEQLRADQALGPRFVAIVSSVLGLSFEVLVVDPASPNVAPHNVLFVSSDQGPHHAPVFAGTLVLFETHWYPAAARI